MFARGKIPPAEAAPGPNTSCGAPRCCVGRVRSTLPDPALKFQRPRSPSSEPGAPSVAQHASWRHRCWCARCSRLAAASWASCCCCCADEPPGVDRRGACGKAQGRSGCCCGSGQPSREPSCELWPAPRADCRALWPAAVRTAAAKGWQHAMGKKAAGKDKQRPAITIPACSGLPEAATELQMAGGTGCWA